MLVAAFVAASLGAILSQHFKALVLLPGSFAAVASALALGALLGDALTHSLIVGLCAAVGVQLGYGLGLVAWQMGTGKAWSTQLSASRPLH